MMKETNKIFIQLAYRFLFEINSVVPIRAKHRFFSYSNLHSCLSNCDAELDCILD